METSSLQGRKLASTATILGMFAVVSLGGCPSTPIDTGGDQDGAATAPVRAEIITPSSSFGIALQDPPVQVRYSVPTTATDVRGFRVPVADESPNSPPIDGRIIVATGLGTGTNRFFDFDPQEADVGFFRVGILYVIDGQEKSAESAAVIRVQGPPGPVFIQPLEPITSVQVGDAVTVTFDCQDPEGQVQWRLFYFSSADSRTVPADRLGTQLSVGTGNVGTQSFQTDGLDADDYTLGVSCTDSGSSIAATVAASQDDRIVTIPSALRTTPTVRVTDPEGSASPTIAITAPGAADVSLYKDDPFVVRFVGAVLEPGATGTIEVFYDTDTNVSNGFSLIADELPVATTSFAFPKDAPAGTYYIGATIRDGINNPVTAYSTGRITVVRNVTLTVTDPNTSLPVSPGASVNIKWTTNAPDTAGTVDVFAQTVDASGLSFGADITILTGAAMNIRTATFASTTPGLFQLSVRLNLRDATTVQQSAPKNLRISSLPPIIWLGSIAETNPGVDGAVFGGVNFEDNAGTAFATAGDLDGDGRDEFVIAARYGKPSFLNPSGIGPGEAYIIYGKSGSARLSGSFHLNSVGTSLLRGLTLTGIPTVDDSDETDGLGEMRLIPDTDGDDRGELVFAFPRVNSAKQDALEREGQFLAGGVVILSSDNSLLQDPGADQPVIKLDQVGRRFSNQTVTPGGVAACLADRQVFRAGDPNANPPTVDACINGTDTVLDTIIGPSVGFHRTLAPACWEQLGFTPIDAGTSPELNRCVTQSALVGCIDVFSGLNGGSGFYPATAIPLEPRGARVLGSLDGDRFGSSVTSSRTGVPGSPGELIISAANRTASAGEVQESEIPESGVAYMFNNRHLWGIEEFFNETRGLIPPTPHQYVAGGKSHCGDGRAGVIGAPRITGDTQDNIEKLLGIADLNNDGRDDFVVGAPLAGGGQGKVYIAFRREVGTIGGLEGNFILKKLALATGDPQRLDGVLISAGTPDGLGSSLAGGFDFNGDKIPDLVIGSPNADGGTGEVVIVFGGTGISSPAGGITVQALLSQSRTAGGEPVAARIKGDTVGGEKGLFGFNVANAGDVDGDGIDDLLIAAPGASPRFDADPNDGVDQLDTLGVDVNLDGVRDEVPGDDELRQAGLVYLIYGANRLDQIRSCEGTTTACSTSADCAAGVACTLSDVTINVNQLGTSRLKGLIIAGRRAGDRIGGGDAGDVDAGGITTKLGRGRSQGLAGAGDVDGDGRADILIGSVLADPRRDPNTGTGVQNGGEAYLVYGSNVP